MKVKSETSDQRRLTIEASLAELRELYEATRQGRRTKSQQRALERFGDALVHAEPALMAQIAFADIIKANTTPQQPFPTCISTDEAVEA
jgi:hypothetical protein